MRQGRERCSGCDVVDEEESVGVEIRGAEETAVLFLTGGVCEVEVVCAAIDGAGDRVRVFDCGVVFRCPLAADEPQGD